MAAGHLHYPILICKISSISFFTRRKVLQHEILSGRLHHPLLLKFDLWFKLAGNWNLII